MATTRDVSIPFTNAVYDRLAADAALVADLDEYAGGPAIVAQVPVPPGVEGVYITIAPPVAGRRFDTKDRDGFLLTSDVGIYGPRATDYNRVDRVADAVTFLLHRANLVPSGWYSLVVSAAAPILAPTDDTMTGRIVTLSAILRSDGER